MKGLSPVVIAVALFLGARTTLAAGQSAGAFQPANPSDQPYLVQNGGFVGNQDTVNFHVVIAGLGLVTGLSSYTYTVYGTQNGHSGGSCSMYARLANGNASLITSTFLIPAGFGGAQFQIPISININNSGIYALDIACNLPPLVNSIAFGIRGVN